MCKFDPPPSSFCESTLPKGSWFKQTWIQTSFSFSFPYAFEKILKTFLYVFLCKNSTFHCSPSISSGYHFHYSEYTIPKDTSSQVSDFVANYFFKRRYLKIYDICSYVKKKNRPQLWPHSLPPPPRGGHNVHKIKNTLLEDKQTGRRMTYKMWSWKLTGSSGSGYLKHTLETNLYIVHHCTA